MLQTIDGADSIWILDFEPVHSKFQIVKFSKAEKRVVSLIEPSKDSTKDIPFGAMFRLSQGTMEKTNYFWLLTMGHSPRTLFVARVDKDTAQITTTDLPQNNDMRWNLISNGGYIWGLIYPVTKALNNGPNLVKIFPDDMHYDLLPLSSGIPARTKSIYNYFFGQIVGVIPVIMFILLYFFLKKRLIYKGNMEAAIKKVIKTYLILDAIGLLSFLLTLINQVMGMPGIMQSGIGLSLKLWVLPFMLGPIIVPLGVIYIRRHKKKIPSEEYPLAKRFFRISKVVLSLWILSSSLTWYFLFTFKT